MKGWDAHAFAAELRQNEELRALGVRMVEVQPSPVSGSPYLHVELYVSEDGPEGPYVAVSEASEYEESEGMYLGAYEAYGEDGNVEECETLADLRRRIPVRVEELMRACG